MSDTSSLTPTRKRLFASLAALLLTAVMAFLIVTDFIEWHRRGWAGLSFPVRSDDRADREFVEAMSPSGRVHSVRFGGPAHHAGFRLRDRVVSINGIPITDWKRLNALASSARRGDRFAYVVSRGDHALTMPLTLISPFSSGQRVITLALSVLVAAAFLVIGLFIYWKKPDDRRSLIFFLMSLSAAAYFFIEWLELHSFNPLGFELPETTETYLQALTTLISHAAAVMFPTFLLHLALVFPRDRPIVQRRPLIFRWIYGVPLASLTIFALLNATGLALAIAAEGFGATVDPLRHLVEVAVGARFTPVGLAGLAVLAAVFAGIIGYCVLAITRSAPGTAWLESVLDEPAAAIAGSTALTALFTLAGGLAVKLLELPNASKYFAFIMFLVLPSIAFMGAIRIFYIVVACVVFYLAYREAGVEEKSQVRWPLWGTISAFSARFAIGLIAFLILSFLGQERGQRYVDLETPIGRAFYLLIPISFAFAILKHRLMEINLIIKRTVVYTVLSGIILAVYLIFVFGLGTMLVKTAGVEDQTVVVLSTLLVAAIFVPVRNRVQGFVDRRFFRRKFDYGQALKQLTHQLPEARDAESMLQTVAENLLQALQSRSVVIFANLPPEKKLWAVANVGLPDETVGRIRFDPDSPLLPLVTGPISPSDSAIPAHEAEKLRRIRSVLLIPLGSQEETAGFISLGGKLSDEEYDAEDREFLVTVSDQVSVALDILRLRREEREYETAREIQQGLLPRDIPQIDGCVIAGMWQPARAVGGDYYDVLKFDEKRVALCIGDVVGKGMPAALLMSSLQATVKAVASPNISPRELCDKIKQVVCHSLSAGKFITFFYAVVDSEAGKIVYTNAGHNPPILLRQGGELVRLEQGGTALGRIFRAARYEQFELPLRSGDRVILFTDGVSEAQSPQEEEFGEARLIQLIRDNSALRADELQKRIYDTVSEFTQGNFNDDVTLAVVSID